MKTSPIEVGLTKCSHHLVFESSLHVRLLPATLQLGNHANCGCTTCVLHSIASSLLVVYIIEKKTIIIPADNTSSAEIMRADVLVQSECNTYIVSLNAYFVCG